MTATDDNGMQDRAADYKGEGGERAANNKGIRARWAESMKNKEIKFMQKDFIQQYGLSSWIFCSHQNTQCPLLDLSVLYWPTLSGKANIISSCLVSNCYPVSYETGCLV
jgi:hypothetical protein